MKKIISNISKTLLIIGVVFSTWSCSDDWLTLRTPSMDPPESVFSDVNGLLTLLAAAEANMRWTFSGEGAMINTEVHFSDVAVVGQTDQTVGMNWDIALTPTSSMNVFNNRVGRWWSEAWLGINNANTVLAHIQELYDVLSEENRNHVIGAAYFHRAWRYFNLVNQFGDVPWIETETVEARFDLFSYCRWSILERLREDLEFAFEWLPPTNWRGRVNRYAAGVLLMKVEKSLLNFERAIQLGEQIIAAHPMMTNRFGQFQHLPRTTLMHDLHHPLNMVSGANTEGIHLIINNPNEPEGTAGNQSMLIMRDLLPFWQSAMWNAPGQGAGMQLNPPFGAGAPNYNLLYGRGIARTRSSHFHLFTIWDMNPATPIGDVHMTPGPTNRHVNDMRSPLHVDELGRRTAWRFPEDLTYNADSFNPNLGVTDPALTHWFGANVVRPANRQYPITGAANWTEYIRAWFHWPHYRVYRPRYDARVALATGEGFWGTLTQHNGGATPWYVYRSAEVYLMLAEAHYWLGQYAQAANRINAVRNRAGALPIATTDVDMAMILAERARELFMEELRNSELTRIAFTYAKTGKMSSVFNRTYSLANISGPGGADTNIKTPGVNFFFDWIMHANNFMRDRVTIGNAAQYNMSVHHILWPIPQGPISDNILGHINQNIGYAGAENNIPPRQVPPRAYRVYQ